MNEEMKKRICLSLEDINKIYEEYERKNSKKFDWHNSSECHAINEIYFEILKLVELKNEY